MKTKFICSMAMAAAFLLAVGDSVKADGVPLRQTKVQTAPSDRANVSFGIRPGLPWGAMAGKAVLDRQGARVGQLQDLIIEPWTGHVVCALVAPEGVSATNADLAAVPPGVFFLVDGQKAVLSVDGEAVAKAPRFGKARMEEIYRHYEQKPYWDTKYGLKRTYKVSEMIGMVVLNNNKEELGNVVNFTIDLPAGRTTLAVISFDGTENTIYAVPPSAFKGGATRDVVVLDAAGLKVVRESKPLPAFAQQFNDPNWLAAVYQEYGQQPEAPQARARK
ncbi:MAG TPA: PRC-barrel domain-containing protein [Verrucomicrobiae bacterium]|nr:PRC-barrel domain-containing protein [Verrucomicrobiae bacterium]